jgi:hypothetical protein
MTNKATLYNLPTKHVVVVTNEKGKRIAVRYAFTEFNARDIAREYGADVLAIHNGIDGALVQEGDHPRKSSVA